MTKKSTETVTETPVTETATETATETQENKYPHIFISVKNFLDITAKTYEVLKTFVEWKKYDYKTKTWTKSETKQDGYLCYKIFNLLGDDGVKYQLSMTYKGFVTNCDVEEVDCKGAIVVLNIVKYDYETGVMDLIIPLPYIPEHDETPAPSEEVPF